uniref:Matrin-type domain-containing protein n=1 Tax=Acrobeloides nanus TaxID=290746 RepID=A0A914EGX2_9BILA
MQDRYDMIKEDVEHLEEKLEELRDECENVNMEVNNLCEDLNDTNSNQNQRRSRLSRFRLDRQARNLFAPIFRFGQGGMRSYGRGRSTSLSSDEGFIFGRINTPQNQINIVFNGPSNDGRIQINDSSNDFEELPDYTDISPNWASSPEPQQNVDHDSNYILRNYHTNANGRVMARCYLCDVVFYDDENAIRTHCRGARHRELSHLNRESNLQVFAELEDRSDTPVAQTFQPDPILNFFDDITEPLSNNMSVVNNNRPMEQDSNNYQPIIQINNEPIIRINDPNSYIRNRRGIRHSAHQPFRNTFQSEYRPNVQEELVNNRYSNFNSNENRNSTPNWHGMQRQGNSRHDRIWNNDNGHRRIVWGNNRENRRRGRNHRLGTTNSNDPNISTNSSSSSTSIGLQHPSEEIWDSPWIEPTDTTTNNLSSRNSLAGRQQSNITHNRNTNSNHHYLGQTNASMNNAQPNMNKSHNKNVHSNGTSTWYPTWNPTLQSNHQTNNSGNGHNLLDLLTSAELEPSSSQGQSSNNLRAKSNRPTGNQNEHQSNPSNSHNTTASNQSDRSFMQRRGGSNARGRGNEKSSWSIWE